MGISNEASIASLRRGNNWLLPPARSEQLVNLHVYLTTVELNDYEDYYVWEIDGKTSDRYSTGTVYNKLCEEGSLVPWFRTIWTKSGIPRHNFLSWLFVLNRCPTRDRIMHWGHQTNPLCLLCNQYDENIDHLFFMCQYSWNLWGSLSLRCGIHPERAWDRVLAQIQTICPSSIKGTLLRLCWKGCIYWTWMERNARLHRQIFRSSDTVARLLDRQIRDMILSLRSTNPASSSRLMQQWLV